MGLESRALPVKIRAEDRTIPQDGSGEPTRAWSPAWDMIALFEGETAAKNSRRVRRLMV